MELKGVENRKREVNIMAPEGFGGGGKAVEQSHLFSGSVLFHDRVGMDRGGGATLNYDVSAQSDVDGGTAGQVGQAEEQQQHQELGYTMKEESSSFTTWENNPIMDDLIENSDSFDSTDSARTTNSPYSQQHPALGKAEFEPSFCGDSEQQHTEMSIGSDVDASNSGVKVPSLPRQHATMVAPTTTGQSAMMWMNAPGTGAWAMAPHPYMMPYYSVPCFQPYAAMPHHSMFHGTAAGMPIPTVAHAQSVYSSNVSPGGPTVAPTTMATTTPRHHQLRKTTQYRGVSWHKHDSKWTARAWKPGAMDSPDQICDGRKGKSIYLGTFSDPVVAAIAVDEKTIQLNTLKAPSNVASEDYLNLNFPDHRKRALVLEQTLRDNPKDLKRFKKAFPDYTFENTASSSYDTTEEKSHG